MLMYCVKCRVKREAKEVEKATFKESGEPYLVGKCTVCGTGMYSLTAESD